MQSKKTKRKKFKVGDRVLVSALNKGIKGTIIDNKPRRGLAAPNKWKNFRYLVLLDNTTFKLMAHASDLQLIDNGFKKLCQSK